MAKQRSATTPAARDQQMIGYAVDLAEKQLLAGNASAQVITHYLKLATVREQAELAILEEKKELMRTQRENLASQKTSEELYTKALDAMRKYSGLGQESDYED